MSFVDKELLVERLMDEIAEARFLADPDDANALRTLLGDALENWSASDYDDVFERIIQWIQIHPGQPTLLDELLMQMMKEMNYARVIHRDDFNQALVHVLRVAAIAVMILGTPGQRLPRVSPQVSHVN